MQRSGYINPVNFMDFKQTCEKGKLFLSGRIVLLERFSQKLLFFYGKKQPAKVKVVYLQWKGPEGIVFLDTLTLLDLIDAKNGKQFVKHYFQCFF